MTSTSDIRGAREAREPQPLPEPGDTIVWGAKAIGKVIHRTERQTYNLMRTGKLPVRKIGNQYCGCVARLLAYCSGDDVR